MEISENIRKLRERIKASCDQSDREQKSVRVIAISKGVAVERMKEALGAGISDFGENYLQEALPKLEGLKSYPVAWHFTGHLQRNKAAVAAEHFQLIHGADSLRLLEALNKLNKKIDVLLQLKCHPNAANGFLLQDIINQADNLKTLRNLNYRGVMTMIPVLENAEATRPFFQKAYQTFAVLKPSFGESFSELSMGMSGDFQVAVEEGSTMVRIGTAIFGKRGVTP